MPAAFNYRIERIGPANFHITRANMDDRRTPPTLVIYTGNLHGEYSRAGVGFTATCAQTNLLRLLFREQQGCLMEQAQGIHYMLDRLNVMGRRLICIEGSNHRYRLIIEMLRNGQEIPTRDTWYYA